MKLLLLQMYLISENKQCNKDNRLKYDVYKQHAPYFKWYFYTICVLQHCAISELIISCRLFACDWEFLTRKWKPRLAKKFVEKIKIQICVYELIEIMSTKRNSFIHASIMHVQCKAVTDRIIQIEIFDCQQQILLMHVTQKCIKSPDYAELRRTSISSLCISFWNNMVLQ